ncbi:caspase family protein [Roseibium sp.]|uniref:caspase family protein n=1 Tax=Roseibium sp. TaxID=1936156 RepID=UPI003BAC2861
MRRVLLGLFVLMFLATAKGLAAEKRVALVIGNATYEHAGELANPLNDADDIAGKLETLGFEVVKGTDLDFTGMRRTVRDFVNSLKDADIALFYYAGHGLQVRGRNYLVPVDAQLRSENDIDFEAMPISLVMSAMERLSKTNLIFLDACRNNPLARNLARSMGTRSASVGNGLARIGSGVGTLVSFSTQPGNVALDGEGRNSPFTAALVEHLGHPGEDISQSLVRVRVDVLQATGGQQIPWENSSLTGKVILKQEETQASAETPDLQIELAYWTSIKDATDEDYFESYLAQYPNGKFAAIARLKLQDLKRSGTKAKEPAETPQSGDSTKTEDLQVSALQRPEEARREQALPEPGNDKALVRSLQAELNRLGCKAGTADGVWGRKSRQALENYARHSGRNVAALDVSPDLLERLKRDPSRVCPAANGPGLNGTWLLVRTARASCGWKSMRSPLRIQNGVISGGSSWKGTISESGRISLKHYFFYEGTNQSNTLTGTMGEDGGSGTFRHDQGSCHGRFTLTRP